MFSEDNDYFDASPCVIFGRLHPIIYKVLGLLVCTYRIFVLLKSFHTSLIVTVQLCPRWAKLGYLILFL